MGLNTRSSSGERELCSLLTRGQSVSRVKVRHQHFHITPLCSSHLVPLREVGLPRDLRVQEEVTFRAEAMLRADSPQVMFVCGARHPGCPG